MFSRYFHIPSRSYEGAEERDAGIYDVSIKIILIFVTHPCIQSISYVCYISQDEIHLKINERLPHQLNSFIRLHLERN